MPTLELVINAAKASSGAATFNIAIVQIRNAATSASQSVATLNKTLDTTGSVAAGLTRVIAGLFAGFSALQGVREAVKTFAEFEQTMATLRGVTEATASQMSQLNDIALQTGATTRSSAGQAAEGLLILSKAGFDAKEAVESLPAVLALSTAHGIELGKASDYTANILNQFQLTTADTARVVDILSTTANKSQADVTDLAEAFKYAGPTAGALKIPLEEIAGAAGTLSDRGIKASLAGTNLRAIMVDLINPTAKARDTISSLTDPLTKLPLTVKDVDVRLVGLTGAFENLAKAGANTSDLAKIFGVLQISGATALLQNTNRIKELTRANYEAAGSTKALVDIMNDTLMGQFDQLLNVVGVLIIKIGASGLGEALQNFITTAGDAVRLMSGFSDSLVGSRDAAERFIQILKVLGAILAAIVAVKAAGAITALALSLGQAASASLLLSGGLGTVLAILSAIVAYDFGNYLFSEFKDVQIIMANVIHIFQDAWTDIRYGAEYTIAAIQSGWTGFVILLQNTLIGALDTIAAALVGLEEAFASFGVEVNFSSTDLYATIHALQKEFNGLASQQAVRAKLDSISKTWSNELDFNKQVKDASVANTNTDFGLSNRKGTDYDPIASISTRMQPLYDSLERWLNLSNKVADSSKKQSDILGRLIDDYRSLIVSTHSASEAASTYVARQVDITIMDEGAHEDMMRRISDLNKEAAALSDSSRAKEVVSKLNQVAAVAEDAYGRGTDRATAAIEEYTRSLNALLDAKADLRFNEIIRKLEEETRVVSMSNREAKIAVATAKMWADSQDEYGRNAERAIEITNRYTQALSELLDAQASDEFARQLEDMQTQIAVLSKFGEERDIAIQVSERHKQAQEAFGYASEKAAASTALFEEQLRRLKRAQELATIFENVGNSFGQFTTELIFGANSAIEAIENLTRAITEMVFQELVAKKIASFVSTGLSGFFSAAPAIDAPAVGPPFIPSAKGNVLDNGRIVPFASGGIVDVPSFFPMASGNVGLMGEAGPEAIMPLSRGKDGKLGVMMPNGNAPVVHIHITTPDADSFRRSASQVASKMRSALRS